MTSRVRLLTSPGNALMLAGCGHAAWGVVAYHDVLPEVVRAGFLASVGDGIFQTAHARDARAAAFWFLCAAPLMFTTGYLVKAAERGANGKALMVSGRTLIGVCLLGTSAMPRSGFPVVLPIAYSLARRGRRLSRAS
jgi:hypothetical protein